MHNYFIQFDISNFWVLNWYYLVAISVSVTGLIIAYKNYSKSKKKPSKNAENDLSPNYNNIHTVSNNSPVSIINTITTQDGKTKDNIEMPINKEKSKSSLKILFIDDNHNDYKMVSILKKAGWINTRAIKDITDLDNYLILESDIIFVDINGVGTTMFEDQGLGLASALKTKHPQKKVVIYSAETTGDRFHKAFRQVDDSLPKNAEPYQFINLVESLSKLN